MKSAIFITKYKMFRPQACNTLEELVDPEKISCQELIKLNARRKAEIAVHAFDTCSYYRKKYAEAGFGRADLEQPCNFSRLPTLTRDDIRENFDEMISNRFSLASIGYSSTGGSTGVPVTVGTDPRHAVEVISWRRLRVWGAGPGDNSGYIYRVIPRGRAALIRRLLYFPTKRRYLSAANMSEQEMKKFVSMLQRDRAVYLVAYVGALKVLSEYVSKHGIVLPYLRFIWSTAAPLPTYLRREIEEVFGAPVYSQYGCSEFYWIAAERLDRKGLDVDWDIRAVEVLDDNKTAVPQGVYGNLVITDLLNRAFPLIRYEVGDRGRFLPPSENCDMSLPILDFVRGRTADTIVLRDGRRVPGEFWTTIFDPYAEAIRGFHIHQRKDRTIEVKFSPNGWWTEGHREQLVAVLRPICGDTPFELREESATIQDRGKLKFVTSDLEQ